MKKHFWMFFERCTHRQEVSKEDIEKWPCDMIASPWAAKNWLFGSNES